MLFTKLVRTVGQIAVRNQGWQAVICSNGKLFEAHRNYSEAPKELPIAEYEEIKDLPNHKEKLLIDVRDPQELQETGKIPTSINIPLKDVASVLGISSMDAKTFEKTYGRQKPNEQTPLIFSCKMGVRAGKAAFGAADLGYENVKVYKGSWMDWAKHEGL